MDWWTKKKEKKKESKNRALLCKERGAMLLEDIIKCCDGKSNPIKFFSADLILKATDNFSNCNHGFRSFLCHWYSGINDNYPMILIKKFPNKSKSDSGFCRDIAISSMVSGHRNFMKLAGCCLELEYPVMVYYGQKDQYSLIDLDKIVSWKRRMKIAAEIATALAYLHTAFSMPFVYRIMDIDNTLIDENDMAKLSDFSFCIPIPLGERFVKVDTVVGKIGYMTDDYMMNGIVSEKTDAYGFGRVMLMLLVGGSDRFRQFKIKNCSDDDFYSYDSKLMSKIIEECINNDMGEVTEEERCIMNAFLSLSVRCFGLNGEVPTMVEVAKELKKIHRSFENAAESSSS